MMKKILFFTFVGLLMALTSSGQTASDTLQQANDSVTIGSHTEFSAAAQENSVTKAEGDSAYVKNDYASAIQIYEALLKEGEAAEVYYNLGNSYYKAGDIAKAILNYERALLIQPGNADIRANLEIARAKTIDKVIPVPEVFFVSWTKSLINCLSVDAWAKVGVVCFFLLLASLYFFFFSKQIVWKKIGFIAGIVFLVLVLLANVFAFQQKKPDFVIKTILLNIIGQHPFDLAAAFPFGHGKHFANDFAVKHLTPHGSFNPETAFLPDKLQLFLNCQQRSVFSFDKPQQVLNNCVHNIQILKIFV